MRDAQGEPDVAPGSRRARAHEMPMTRRVVGAMEARRLLQREGREHAMPRRGHTPAVVRVDDEVHVEPVRDLRELRGEGVVGQGGHEAAHVVGEPDRVRSQLLVAAEEDAGEGERHRHEDEQQHAVQIHPAEEGVRAEAEAHRPREAVASW